MVVTRRQAFCGVARGCHPVTRYGHLPEVGDSAPTNVPAPQGLTSCSTSMASPGTQCGVSHRKHLYVADEAGDAVKVFEVKTGRLVARIKGRRRTRPVHHILHRETLYVGAAGSGSILAFDIPVKAPCGMCRTGCE